MAADIGVDAVKIGMLGTAETVRAVREALGHIEDGVPIVIDPVMVAESGAVLLDDEARAAIVTELLPLATVITPNLPEARVLAARARGGGAATGVRTRRRWRRRSRRRGRARRRRGPRAGAARARAGQRGRHGRPPRRGHGRLLRRHERSRCCPGSAIPTARRTGPGARIRARSPRTSRSASARWRRRGRRGAIASEAVRDGHREHRPGTGPGQRARRRRPGTGRRDGAGATRVT